MAAMTRRRVAALLVLVLVAAAAAVLAAPRTPAPAQPAPADEPAFAVSPPPSAPTGAPFVLGRAPRPERVRWKGTFSYEAAPSGRFGPEPAKPGRRLAGTFAAVETTTGPASARETAVEAAFELEDAVPPAAARKRSLRARLSFARDAGGNVVHRSIRLDAPADVQTELELLQAAFAGRFSLPVAAVRVGERLPIEDVVDVDDLLHRPLLFLFRDRAVATGPVNAPAEGGAWVASRTADEGGERVVLKLALTHAFAGENGPKGSKAPNVDYRAKLEGERAFDVADGRVTRHELSLVRRIRFAAPAFDYVVVVRSRIAMAEDGVEK